MYDKNERGCTGMSGVDRSGKPKGQCKYLFKRLIAAIISISMVLGLLPWDEIARIYAYDEESYYVNKVIVTKIYGSGLYDVTNTRIALKGINLKDIAIVAETSQGLKTYSNPEINTPSAVEFIIDGNVVGETITVGSADISIDQANIPTMSKIDKRVVQAGNEGISIQGANLDRVGTTDGGISYGAYFEDNSGSSGQKSLPVTSNSEGELSTGSINGTLGLQNIVFKKQYAQEVDFKNNSGTKTVEVTIQNTYNDQFRLIDEINLIGLNMNPNRGQVGDDIIFTADNGLDDYDVFLIKNLTDKFTDYNKCKDPVFRPDVDEKQTLTVIVPDYKLGYIENGEYYVVITNKIPNGADPDKSINKQYVLSEKFTIIDASQKMKILTPLQPDRGPDSGAKVEVSGVFFGSLNISEFRPSDNSITVKAPSGVDEEMTVEYSGGMYKEQTVTSAKRTIKVLVGGVSKFAKSEDGSAYEYSFEPQLDKLSIITPQVTDAETDPVKDVVVETVTTITLQGGEKVIIKERAELEKGYTYEPSKVTPAVTSMTPQKIYVEKASDGSYEISQDTMVAVYGSNILIYKYTDAEGVEEVRYPIVELGADVRLNKNSNLELSNPGLFLKVFDSQERELDGSSASQLGSRILTVIPAGTKVQNLGKTFIKIINPVKNDVIEGRSGSLQYAVEFVSPDVSKVPVIESVTPNTVTTEGGEEVVIEGSNFQAGAVVIIDGKEVAGVIRQQDGKKLTFKAPKGREGVTQIQVVNTEGGIAIAEFRYVKTYTDPKINSFSPEKGSSGTLVVVKGDNFVKPDPTAGESDILKLVGTRVLLGGKDINSYNRDTVTKNIILKGYVAPDGQNEDQVGKLLRIAGDTEKLKLEDYYHSVVMQDTSTGRYFTIDVDSKGEVQLSNGTEKFTILKSVDGIKAKRESGQEYKVSITTDPEGAAQRSDYLELDLSGSEAGPEYRLKLLTPFTVDSGTGLIDGDKVKVKGIDELYFWVPVKEAEGYYDLTVQNPDTKKDSRTGQEGFYYYKQPYSDPNITLIDPKEGSVEGGYSITISATSADGRECFVDNGEEKTRVFINGVEVEADDVSVSTDGFSIDAIVPPVGFDIQQKYGGGRLSVPVVVTNPDGGTDGVEEGFTYVVPTSHPKITKMVPNEGSAAGGNIVEITGSDFRFFEPYTDSNGDGEWNPGEPYLDLNGHKVNKTDWTKQVDDGTLGPDDFSGKDIQFLQENLGDDYENLVGPVLPTVFFGKKKAAVRELSAGYIKVIAPLGAQGDVDVYVVNNDSGISNKEIYVYSSSNPAIDQVIPSKGPKAGKNDIEIFGTGFSSSTISIYDENDAGEISKVEKKMPVIRFGSISNRDIPRDQQNSGRIDSSRTTVELTGNLRIEYDGKADTLNLSAAIDEKTFSVEVSYTDDKAYIPLTLMKDEHGIPYNAYEMISVEVLDKRLIVDKGFSPQTQLVDANHIELKAASYHTIGEVDLTVINPDGGKVSGVYEYKNPDSNPEIVNIEKDSRQPERTIYDFGAEQKMIKLVKVTYKGGNTITVTGNDFRENADIQIGNVVNVAPADIDYTLPSKLTFTMPEVSEDEVGKLLKLIVMNDDGASVSSEDSKPEAIYIMFISGETAPKIESVTPSKGSSIGGEEVVITGSDFRAGISVFFGENAVRPDDVTLVDYKTLKVITPAGDSGTVDVKVENTDGELGVLSGGFTYISSPIVSNVLDFEKQNEKKRNINIDGGEAILVKGSGFEEGSEVYFMPVIEELEEGATDSDIYVGTKGYKLKESTQAAKVEYIDSETLKVTTPEGKLGEGGLIVVNSDKGASDIYKGITYGLEEIDAPENAKAEIIYDRYIRVTWDAVDGANEYEIYVSEDGGSYNFAVTTGETSFIYQDIEEKTDYRFKIRAVGKISTSNPSTETNEVTTGSDAGYEDKDGELAESTTITLMRDCAQVVIGTDSYRDKTVIDLTSTKLSGAEKAVISIPLEVANSSRAADIEVIGRDFMIQFNPSAFSQGGVDEDGAGVKFTISPSSDGAGFGQTSLSDEYVMEALVYSAGSQSQIYNASGPISLTMDYDTAKYAMRRMKSAYIASYDSYSGSWRKISDASTGYSSSASAMVYKMGRYMVAGSRK